MDRSRWISLGVVVLYLVVFVVAPLSQGTFGGEPGQERSFTTQYAGGVLLFLGFVSVWWSELLGDALWMGRGAWNPQPSSSGAMKAIGWIFLVLAFMVHPVLARWVT